MSDETQIKAEWVSALMDGELRDSEFVHAIDHLERCESAREAWDTYHLVGDVLRSGQLATPAHDAVFLSRLRTQLATTAMDIDVVAVGHVLHEPVATKLPSKPAANDGWWRRVVGLASIAFVGLLVWQVQGWVGLDNVSSGKAVLAKLPAQPVVAVAPVPQAVTDEETPIMLRDPQLDALLAAHRQHGGVTALQMSAGFLRNATFNEANR